MRPVGLLLAIPICFREDDTELRKKLHMEFTVIVAKVSHWVLFSAIVDDDRKQQNYNKIIDIRTEGFRGLDWKLQIHANEFLQQISCRYLTSMMTGALKVSKDSVFMKFYCIDDVASTSYPPKVVIHLSYSSFRHLSIQRFPDSLTTDYESLTYTKLLCEANKNVSVKNDSMNANYG
ncbi:hypothetical protein STEG23_001778, partial [Scotinomys teguina]